MTVVTPPCSFSGTTGAAHDGLWEQQTVVKQQEDTLQEMQMMHRAHVLVVSETLSMGNVFRLILQHEGHYRVTTAEIREIEPAFVAHLHPDLVLVDVKRSSRERGWALLERLRTSLGTKEVALVLCAPALALLPEQECWLMQQGMALLLKPFGREALLQAVSRALGKETPGRGLGPQCDERSSGDGMAWN